MISILPVYFYGVQDPKGIQKGVQKGIQKGIQKGVQNGVQKRLKNKVTELYFN